MVQNSAGAIPRISPPYSIFRAKIMSPDDEIRKEMGKQFGGI